MYKYNNNELITNYRNNHLHDFADLQSVIDASIAQNYQSEIQLINNDESLSTREKISLGRNSLWLLLAAGAARYFIPQIYNIWKSK